MGVCYIVALIMFDFPIAVGTPGLRWRSYMANGLGLESLCNLPICWRIARFYLTRTSPRRHMFTNIWRPYNVVLLLKRRCPDVETAMLLSQMYVC